MISRHDESMAAYRIRVANHFRSCRDDDCQFCEAEAEDRAAARERD